ncbi:LysR substrate-binding domain-containing protein [soil metagenome]
MAEPLHETFVVVYVLGVTPGKWAGIWNERMPRHPLALRPCSPAEAVAALASGEAQVALLRLPLPDDPLSSIPLYVEKPVVVVPKDHAIEALDSVTVRDLDHETLLDTDWAADVELVAANVGIAVMPQSVARALSRRDVVARPVTDGPETQVALAWLTTSPEVEEFIGIVRGRTANSSRGEPTPKTPKPVKPPKAARPARTKRPTGPRKPRRR